MGLVTGKVSSYATRCKSCRVCDSSKRSGKAAKNHDCRKNHAGSSKSMERDVACELWRSQLLKQVLNFLLRLETMTAQLWQIYMYMLKCHMMFKNGPTQLVHNKRSLTSRLYNLKESIQASKLYLSKLFCIKSKGDQLFQGMFQLCYISKCRKSRCFKSKSSLHCATCI